MSVSVGSDVICLVDRLYTQKADLTVIGVIDTTTGRVTVVPNPVRGSIRIQDVRSFDIDKAVMTDHFGVGDTVRALTLSTGDVKSVFFSTTGLQYGVIHAKDPMDAAGVSELLPVDQSHMRNVDGVVFKRKVAKPDWIPSRQE